MPSRRSTIALLIAFVVSACGTTTTSTPPSASAAVASPTPVAVAGEASPSAVATATPEPTPTASPTASPTPSPKPTPVPWKQRTSKRFKYSIKYPPTWIATPGNAKRSDQYDDFSTHYVYISRDTVSGTISISRTVTTDIAWFRSHYKTKVVSNKKITVGGWPGRLVTFNGSDGGNKVFIQYIVVGKGRVGYFLEMFSDRGNQKADMALFKKMYKTFKRKP